MVLFTPARGQTKPGGSRVPRIDWSHPLTQGLLLYCYDTGGLIGPRVALGGASLTAIDLVTGSSYYQMGGSAFAVTLTVTPFGAAYQYDTNHSNTNSTVLGPIRTATAAGNYTFACAFIKNGTAASYANVFGRTANNNASAPYVNWDFEVNPNATGQQYIVADCNSNATLATTTSGTISDNTFTSAVGTLAGGAGSSRLSLYLQGVLATQTAATNLTPASANTNDNLMVGGASGASPLNPFNGVVFYGAFWNRVLSPPEIQMLHLEPYGFLLFDLDEVPAVPYAVAAGGGAQTWAMLLA